MTDTVDPNHTVTLTPRAKTDSKPGDDFENIVFNEDMIDAPSIDGSWALGETKAATVDGWDLVPFTESSESVLLPDATDRWQHFNRLRHEQALAEFVNDGMLPAARLQAAAAQATPVRRNWARRALFAGMGVIALAGALYGVSLFDSRTATGLFPTKTATAPK